jgi:serine/threonine protein kinase
MSLIRRRRICYIFSFRDGAFSYIHMNGDRDKLALQMNDPGEGRSLQHAPPTDPVSTVAVGRVLRDRYVLKSWLGTHGKGVVFRAHDRFRATLPDAHQDVALKILHAEGDCSEQTFANLRLEAHCAQLLSHRNIVNVYELDRDGDVIFCTMELLEGELLSHITERLRPATMARAHAWRLIHQLCDGLAHAHERGIVHGDLKPQNILITREGELRILGFGAAQRVEASKSKSSSERGECPPTFSNPAYASCEQLEGRRVDPRDDLYALACICYELLAGTHPFDSRPATLARDYHVSLIPPPGLGGRQLRALRQGLSWHRAGRSIGVRSWMHRLMSRKMQQHSLTPLQELMQPNHAPSKTAWRAAALFLVATLGSAAIVTQLKSTSAPTAGEMQASTPAPAPAPAPADNQDLAPLHLGEPVVTDFLEPPASASPKSETAETFEAKPMPRSTASLFSVKPSQVKSDDHFAEIRLHREALHTDGTFTWWTEPATAKPDVDYKPQAAAIQSFPAGYRATRLYVKLLPRPLRSQRSYFYIAIAKLGPHQTPGAVIRRQVWLPASSDLAAQR